MGTFVMLRSARPVSHVGLALPARSARLLSDRAGACRSTRLFRCGVERRLQLQHAPDRRLHRSSFPYLLKSKDLAGQALQILIQQVGQQAAGLRVCRENAIRLSFSLPDSYEHNGVAECSHRTIVETTRSLLISARLPVTFWSWAYRHAVYLTGYPIGSQCQSPSSLALRAVVRCDPFGYSFTLLRLSGHLQAAGSSRKIQEACCQCTQKFIEGHRS
jgi:hypothetical protein